MLELVGEFGVFGVEGGNGEGGEGVGEAGGRYGEGAGRHVCMADARLRDPGGWKYYVLLER